MSKFLSYEQCPKCLEKGRDNRGDNLGVYSDGSAHCWACGHHVFPKHYIKQEKKELDVPKGVLPPDFTREVPARGWQWLLQYGLPYSYWKPFVGWSEKYSRLVITVGEPCEFSIGRWIGEDNLALPAGNHASRRKWWAWGNCHKTAHVFGTYSESKEVVLVEDVISAHKIGSITGRCAIPLFGTRVFDAVVPVLRHIGLPLVLWLDKDQEHTMPKKADHLAALTGLGVRYVVTDDDPKDYNPVKIEEILDVAR